MTRFCGHSVPVVIPKNFKPLLQPLRWRCVECAIHHERDVREE